MLDERLVKALHVEVLRRQDLHTERGPHLLFQASTIEALLDGAYDGDVTFRELGEHGDFGLGTFDACDGEMIALEGTFLRAALDGSIHPVEPERRTPFAVLTYFEPTHRFQLADPLDDAGFMHSLDTRLGDLSTAHALRVDGHFDTVRARSVPRQHKPYPPMTEVVENQRGHVLACATRDVTVQVDDEVDMHVELPRGVELTSPESTSDAALRRVERQG
jgi:alpha-acetolactate decarboxylase